MSLTALNSTTHSSRALKPRNVEMRRRIEFSASLWPFHQNISKSAIFPLSVGFCAYTRGFPRVYGVFGRVYGVFARVYGVFARVYGVFARVYGVFARVYEGFARVYEDFARVYEDFARVYGDSAAVCGVLARVRRGFAHLCACAEPHSFGT